MTTTAFDDRDGVIWLDGAFVPWRDARLHVLSHGLHYGGGIFEGIRVYGGRAFKPVEHFERFHLSARELNFRVPFSATELDAAMRETIRHQNIVDGYIRPVAWRGSEQISVSGAGTSVHVAIAAWEWPHVFSDDARSRGIRLRTSRWRRPSPDTAPVRAKAASLYNICTLARDEAEAAGFDDALLLDFRGYLAEATGANLFLVIDGALHTPTADTFLDGITRQTVLSLAEDLGIAVHERHIRPEELHRADELFLTGTAYEVQPVCAVDGHSYEVGGVTSKLSEAYTDLTRSVTVP
ncbi:Branched-chain-amino-acid transaminase [Streptomyces venezuelae]|uniref:branched-chain amino acid aminotransferase n=1 Tax=Streptomyces gardneri TaxID=66892 RepID=UPI0006BDCABE|nr:branched-chain amino acid aminotransferase [Streptomyces gardneri]ALO06662.1 Branched-chain-amino-acid transaminase [Streptomyces venezuelae]QPK44070.1 branched-chain amino acid aminotransferase [Streptomyces gardneri]WRK35344.1 branched-chain amino acid aminotransferase [Streptomyces venezuelae]CUM43054.1 Branched-chain amino acid aminotransferase [Streptomyces venezuelae]